MMYAVKCYRSAASIFGPHKEWLKGEGESIMTFETMDAAESKAEEMNDTTSNFRVWYKAKEFTGNGGTFVIPVEGN